MKSARDIFIEFEESAIEWGKRQQQIFGVYVGDIVTSKCRGVRTRRLAISHISVVIGRKPRLTTRKSFGLEFVGRRMKKDGSFIDGPGGGIVLSEFTKENGVHFSYEEQYGLTERINDCGLSFTVDADPKAMKLYPNAYMTYRTAKNVYSEPVGLPA